MPARKRIDVMKSAEHAWHGAGRAVTRLARQVELAITPVGLTVPQYRLMCLVAEGMTLSSDVAEQLAIRPASVSELVDGMVAKRWLVRGTDPNDRRRGPLALTKAGARILEDAHEAINRRLRSIADYFAPESDLSDPLAALELWHDALERYWDDHLTEGKPRKDT